MKRPSYTLEKIKELVLEHNFKEFTSDKHWVLLSIIATITTIEKEIEGVSKLLRSDVNNNPSRDYVGEEERRYFLDESLTGIADFKLELIKKCENQPEALKLICDFWCS